MSKTVKVTSEYRELPIAQLEECPLNPRRILDDAALNELAASIKAQGLLLPVLVRPAGDKFQVVAGKRRYRAAQRAEVETLRAEVRELTDAECIEIAIVENLQRRDVHPMEEECPKRTGFNTLLFGELGSQHDSCTDAACLNHKLTRFVERQVEAKPELVQIATSRITQGEGPVLPRTRYVALHLTNPAKSKQPLSPYQKPCKHMAEAIVVDGAERGHTVKVCAEQSCGVHFADRRTPSPAQVAKEREQRRKELEKRKFEITVLQSTHS